MANEGEAQRYFDHAVVLKKTIQFVRNNNDIVLDSENQAPGLGEKSNDGENQTYGLVGNFNESEN